MPDFPTLETHRLWLRQETVHDTDAVFAILSDPKVTEFHDLETFIQPKQAQTLIQRRIERFQSGRGVRWGIAHKPHPTLIGSCGFIWLPSTGTAEVGYELASSFWRQGIMTEALQGILDYGFEQLELQRVTAQVMIDNSASKALLQTLGFQSQGVLHQHGFWKGQYHDLEQFCLMADSYRATQRPS